MSDQLMYKQHSWPFPCIKPKFEGHSLPDEVVRLVASFALPPHPLKEAFLLGADEDGVGVWALGFFRYGRPMVSFLGARREDVLLAL